MNKIDFTILDPIGNLTALVSTKTPKSRRSLVAKRIMTDYPTVEQIGFIINGNLEMMGGELSVNGTLAAGYYLSSLREAKQRSNLDCRVGRLPLPSRNDVDFYTSGVKSEVKYFLKNNLPTISLTIPYKIVKIDCFYFVDLGGIGYFVEKCPFKSARTDAIGYFLEIFEDFRKRFENKLNRNAWGVVFYNKNRIWPVVYVKDRQGKTLEKRLEMACGSGSLAYSLISSQEKIIQPSGEIIRIKKKGNKFEISGKVKILASQEVVLRGYEAKNDRARRDL